MKECKSSYYYSSLLLLNPWQRHYHFPSKNYFYSSRIHFCTCFLIIRIHNRTTWAASRTSDSAGACTAPWKVGGGSISPWARACNADEWSVFQSSLYSYTPSPTILPHYAPRKAFAWWRSTSWPRGVCTAPSGSRGAATPSWWPSATAGSWAKRARGGARSTRSGECDDDEA